MRWHINRRRALRLFGATGAVAAAGGVAGALTAAPRSLEDETAGLFATIARHIPAGGRLHLNPATGCWV